MTRGRPASQQLSVSTEASACLQPRTVEVLRAIEALCERWGYPPSYAQIGAAVTPAISHQRVQYHVDRLRAAGLLPAPMVARLERTAKRKEAL